MYVRSPLVWWLVTSAASCHSPSCCWRLQAFDASNSGRPVQLLDSCCADCRLLAKDYGCRTEQPLVCGQVRTRCWAVTHLSKRRAACKEFKLGGYGLPITGLKQSVNVPSWSQCIQQEQQQQQQVGSGCACDLCTACMSFLKIDGETGRAAAVWLLCCSCLLVVYT